MMAQAIHKTQKTTTQALPDPTRTLFTMELDHIISSRADVVQRLTMIDQCAPVKSAL